MAVSPPDAAAIEAAIDAALAEDIGCGDMTTAATVPDGHTLSVEMRARQPLVVAGLPVAEAVFKRLDAGISMETEAADGDHVAAGAVLMRLKGPAHGILTGERTALNFVQKLSGIATLTRTFVDAIDGTKATLLDTRKTIPGLRKLSKYATRCGGAKNHRMRLDDGILIKDNHIAAAGSLGEAVKRAKAADTGLTVQAECDTLDQVKEALDAGAEALLLDNMAPETLSEAVALVAGKVPLEASGGVTLETIGAIAKTGVDYISVGAITQSAPALDIGLDLKG